MSNTAVLERTDAPLLRANGHTLSTAPDRMGRLTPSDPAEGVERLRERFNAIQNRYKI